MTSSQLKNIIKKGENISVEFKKCTTELNSSVFETVCSFLNRNGGRMILGVSDNGVILGINENNIEAIIKNFINTVNNPELLNPTFYFSPEIFSIEGKKIIHIYIPESSQVHRYKGKIYDRVGDADNDITNNHYLINNTYLRKNQNFTENEVLPFLEIADLSSDTFKKARRLCGVWDDNHPWLTMNDAEMLRFSGLWRKDNQTGKEGYTLAAALLFGKENTVLSCCPAYKTDAIYRNMTYSRFLHPLPGDPDVRYDDRDDIRENLIEAYQRLMTFVNRNLPDKFHIEGIQRIDIRDKIFREIAANMLIHREFLHSFPAKFLVFSDRVITENWSKPSGQNHVTLDNLETYPKNPIIAKVFKELGWVEELGSGRKNIKKYAPYYYPNFLIDIENKEKFIFSILYRDVEEDKMLNEKINDMINDKLNNKINENLSENERINNKKNDKINENDSLNDKINKKINENISESERINNKKNDKINESDKINKKVVENIIENERINKKKNDKIDENDKFNGKINKKSNVDISENERINVQVNYKINENDSVNDKINDKINKKFIENIIENERINKQKNDKIIENDKVNENLIAIIKYLYNNPHQNRVNLIKLTKKEQATTDRYIKILKDANFIEFRGPRKTGGYYLTIQAKVKIDKKS